ncbi:BCCT family transporter [uncultured Cetobacterium sp.]|uniref:BCCT family transporter n=1 Tax=uncultured Cetobacterium sp. TaxID=527638 RepID=UPI00261CAA39|nr:BCCT family transporter [uncultured Cetobacterium sp.]
MEGNKQSSNSVFKISVLVSLLIVVFGIFFTQSFEFVTNLFNLIISRNFGWVYTLSMTIFLVFSIWIGFFSRFRNIKLSKDNEVPEYSLFSWFAMLFSAGMGVGLIFWGVAEPANYYLAPLYATPLSRQAAIFAFNKSFLHWGMHPWAAYSVIGMALAYMQYRKGEKGLISSLLIPIFGKDIRKTWFGKSIDVLTIIATVGGIATSLGLGVYQINSGLHFLFGLNENSTVQLIIIGITTLIVVLSVSTPLEKGIKAISDINIYLAIVLVLFCFLLGPTTDIIKTFIQGTGIYIANIVPNSFNIGAFDKTKWYGSWTLFYWAWFIAWAPFTGMFIARISKGRTIKEFVSGVLLAPAIVSFLWFSIFGRITINSGEAIMREAVKSTPTAYFVVMSHFPYGRLVCIFTLVLLSTFFITSANSATFVLGMLTSDGSLNPSKNKKIIWGFIQSGMAIALMIGTKNGLQMLQTASITLALPFAFIMVLCIFSFMKALRKEKL